MFDFSFTSPVLLVSSSMPNCVVSPLRSSTALSYEVNVIPRFNFPAIFVERIIRSDMPVNLQALAFRSERNFEGTQKLKMTVNSYNKKLSSKELNASPLPSSPPSSEVGSNWGVFGKVCRLDKPCMVDEVHLRRLDGLLVIRSTSFS